MTPKFRTLGLGLALLTLGLAGCGPRPYAADVTFVGEVHDNPAHHRLEAGIAAATQPAAIVFEMIPAASENDLATLRATGASREAIAHKLHWKTSGWPAFADYAPIMEAAPQAKIYGAELDRTAIAAALDAPDGGQSLLGEGARYYGLNEPLPPAQEKAFEDELQAAHCNALPPAALPRMVRAQRLRDALLAATVVRALKEEGPPVLVIAGNEHVRSDRGAPVYLLRRQPWLSVETIGQSERADVPEGVDATQSLAEDTPFDRLFVSRAPERKDPCEAFGKG